ncbi:MAG: NAD(P)/FAD-dependent oxidoreductase, partial [Bacteroidota bacterium]
MREQVIIIGAGPAGLAAAGRLRERDIPFVILEKGTGVAQCWRDHYDRLRLHTVKQFSHLPSLPFPEDYPLYVPKKELVAYYEAYAEKYNIQPVFNTTVTTIDKQDDTWTVNCTDGTVYTGASVILCAGMNRIPFSPTFLGQEDFQGKIIHSHDYQNPTPYQGKRVLVVGMGNSGAGIALDVCERGGEAGSG